MTALFAALKSAVEKGLSTVGLMLFMQLDHGAILRKETGREAPKMIRFVIAFAKAWGPIGMGIGGRAMAKRAMDTPTFWASLNTISAGRIAPATGGVLILKEGKVVGSIGKAEIFPTTMACCIAGAQSAGFGTEGGEAALGKQ